MFADILRLTQQHTKQFPWEMTRKSSSHISILCGFTVQYYPAVLRGFNREERMWGAETCGFSCPLKANHFSSQFLTNDSHWLTHKILP